MFWFWFFFGVTVLVLVPLLILFLVGRILRYKPYTVEMPHLPAAFEGFRIAVISDLHDRHFGAHNNILAKKVLGAEADLVIMAGDMHESPHPPQPFYDLISTLSAHVPVTYTEGNHDLRHISSPQYRAHMDRIAACGAVVLNDVVWPVERNGQILLLYGQSWRSIADGCPMAFDSSYPTVAVCHDPLQFDRLPQLPDLMISGHVHGGILRLPFVGPVFAPGNGAPLSKRFSLRYFFPKYSKGLYYKGSHTLAVTQGLGFSILPVRFIPPEVMILTLRRAKN